MKKTTSLIILMLLSFGLFAAKVDIEKAKLVAKNFYFSQLELLKGIKNEKIDISNVKFSEIF
jgi:hypothetical protein